MQNNQEKQHQRETRGRIQIGKPKADQKMPQNKCIQLTQTQGVPGPLVSLNGGPGTARSSLLH